MADVFISYHTKSAKNVADQICGELESRGIWCWYAPRDVDPGAYKTSIAAAIRDCKIFLLILNPEADKSEQVKDEIHLARHIYDKDQKAITILPLRLEHCRLSDEIYMEISRFHMIECAASLSAENIQKLLEQAARILCITLQDETPEQSEAREIQPEAQRSNKTEEKQAQKSKQKKTVSVKEKRQSESLGTIFSVFSEAFKQIVGDVIGFIFDHTFSVSFLIYITSCALFGKLFHAIYNEFELLSKILIGIFSFAIVTYSVFIAAKIVGKITSNSSGFFHLILFFIIFAMVIFTGIYILTLF